jgi:methanogenic corrinoid protein MtbC1/DNA-binding transcriptional MerR regulator
MTDAIHPIQMAASLSGLSTYVIRVWELRYRAVEPARTTTKRRLYSQEDIERLSLLREVTQAGHSIGQVARLSIEKLRELAESAGRAQAGMPKATGPETPVEGSRGTCLSAIESMDGPALEGALMDAARRMGVQGVLSRLVSPLVQEVGDRWRDGRLTAAHEHFASGVMRNFLANLSKPFAGSRGAPLLVVATPAGQLHELGALLAGALAANLGWRVANLGASLPAVEIAGAATQKGARAVALSIVYPEDDETLAGELRALRDALPASVALIVGGRAVPAYRSALKTVGAILAEDLAEFGDVLDGLRRPAKSNAGGGT